MTAADRVAEYQAGLAEWRAESAESLLSWSAYIGTDPQTTLTNPHLGLEPTQAMMGHEDLAAIPEDDRNWLSSHLIALVGAILMQRHGGDWTVDDDPASPSYARYVINARGVRYDPGRAVMHYWLAPPGRDLATCIAEAEAAATGS